MKEKATKNAFEIAIADRANPNRNPLQLELRDDVLRAVRFYVAECPSLSWPRILAGVIEALAIVEAANVCAPDDRAKAAALLRHSIEADQ